MISFTLLAELSSNPTFLSRVGMAMNVYAHQVLNESPDTVDNTLRVNMANRVLQMNREGVLSFGDSVAASPAIFNSNAATQDQITDESILEGVSQIWNSLIGINPQTMGGGTPSTIEGPRL